MFLHHQVDTSSKYSYNNSKMFSFRTSTITGPLLAHYRTVTSLQNAQQTCWTRATIKQVNKCSPNVTLWGIAKYPGKITGLAWLGVTRQWNRLRVYSVQAGDHNHKFVWEMVAQASTRDSLGQVKACGGLKKLGSFNSYGTAPIQTRTNCTPNFRHLKMTNGQTNKEIWEQNGYRQCHSPFRLDKFK